MIILTVSTLISSLRKRKTSLGRSSNANIAFLLPIFAVHDLFRRNGMIAILDKNILFYLGKSLHAENELLPTTLNIISKVCPFSGKSLAVLIFSLLIVCYQFGHPQVTYALPEREVEPFTIAG